MTTPIPSVIADAVFAALHAAQETESYKQALITAARTALGPLLPGVTLADLTYAVHQPGDLVHVTDGVVDLGVTQSGQVWLVRRQGAQWQTVARVRTALELAEKLPPALLRGRT